MQPSKVSWLTQFVAIHNLETCVLRFGTALLVNRRWIDGLDGRQREIPIVVVVMCFCKGHLWTLYSFNHTRLGTTCIIQESLVGRLQPLPTCLNIRLTLFVCVYSWQVVQLSFPVVDAHGLGVFRKKVPNYGNWISNRFPSSAPQSGRKNTSQNDKT